MPNTHLTTSPLKVSVSVVQQCIKLGQSNGLSVNKMLAAAEISPEQLADPQGWLPAAAVERLLCYFIEHAPSPLFGLNAATQINIAMLGVFGYAMQTSCTLQDLIETIIRYELLLSDLGSTSLQHEPGVALWRLSIRMKNPLIARHVTECILAFYAGLLRLLPQDQPWPLLAVRFQHAAPKDQNLLCSYEKFFSCPVYFQQAASELVLTPQALSQSLQLANPGLHQTLEQHAKILLSQRKTEPSFVDQVRSVLHAQLLQGASPQREQVAALMGMSGRSLHRHLQELGSNYREVSDALRFDLARACLRESKDSIEDVAQKIGFQESQSFIRWFRTMAGSTPGEFRQKNYDA